MLDMFSEKVTPRQERTPTPVARTSTGRESSPRNPLPDARAAGHRGFPALSPLLTAGSSPYAAYLLLKHIAKGSAFLSCLLCAFTRRVS